MAAKTAVSWVSRMVEKSAAVWERWMAATSAGWMGADVVVSMGRGWGDHSAV